MGPTPIVLAILAVAGILHVVVPWLVLNRHKRRLLELCCSQRAIVITFDDGPGRLLTPLVVARLAEAEVPATFFLLGSKVKGSEDLVDLIRDRGNELGSHGEDHTNHLLSWPWQGMVDTSRAWRRLRGLLGADATQLPFRPPYGKLNLLSLLWVWWHGAPIALWTHDSFDTRLGVELPPDELAARLRRSGGGVVLLHDFDRSLAHADQQVLAKLDAVLALRREGFKFLRIGELEGFGAPAVSRRP